MDTGVQKTRVLRSYRTNVNLKEFQNPPEEDSYIWETVCATCAAPPYFSTITIDNERFMDEGFGTSDPKIEALKEFQRLHTNSPKPLIISVGSDSHPGLGETVTGSSSAPPIMKTFLESRGKGISRDPKMIHEIIETVLEPQKCDYF